MSRVTNIEKLINDDAAACVEEKYNFWKFKPRRHYEPGCKQAAQAKYQDQLNQAYNVEFENELTVNNTLQNSLNPRNNWTTYIVIALFIIVIFLTIS